LQRKYEGLRPRIAEPQWGICSLQSFISNHKLLEVRGVESLSLAKFNIQPVIVVPDSELFQAPTIFSTSIKIASAVNCNFHIVSSFFMFAALLPIGGEDTKVLKLSGS
jgi:hypothetical protein